MPPLLVVAVLSLIGLATVWWALLRDEDDPVEVQEAPVAPEGWDVLPTPSDLSRTEFDLRVPGYDPASVDVAFDALAQVYADLWACADEATRDRARRLIAQRIGREAELRSGQPVARRPAPAIPPGASTDEALLAEAALDLIDRGTR